MSMATRKLLSSIAVISVVALLSACHKTPPVSGTYNGNAGYVKFKTSTKADLWLIGTSLWSGMSYDVDYVQDGDRLTFTTHGNSNGCPSVIESATILNDGAQIKLTSMNCPSKDKSLAIGDGDKWRDFYLSKVLPDADE
ncbi:hypothetical protein [Rhodanobacter denitrificans]|uniref:hypothetical protein n=1 Tax=Rhodanobacter denitrificans TaxID=666685 RepID=UPI0012FE05AC|nr:hypothetical protein [Rhodanobacter denitrificans]UJM85502.1 hypothetical protein LRJ86_12025 [Rhodanobacter denitrificans]